MNKSKLIGGGAILLVVVAALWWAKSSSNDRNRAIEASELPSSQSIVVPELSAAALNGETAFNASCAACHGSNAAGTDQGPPLIHPFYPAKRHADFAFVMAVKSGVRSHHWRFGSMPPVEGVSDAEIQSIITYVREIQAANGI